jgi:hypothetical protein
MATATKVREWAVSEGLARGRGKLGQSVTDRWDTDHPDDPYQPAPGRDGFTGNEPDYPDADFDDNFPDSDPLGDTGETPPRRPKSRARSGATKPRWFFNRRGSKKKPGAKKPLPRVSTEDLLGAAWRGAAKLLTPLPPLQRTLRMQAPVAGMLLDDIVQGSIVDPLLQPLARLVDQGKTVQALAGPPMFVSAIMVHQMQCAAADPPADPNPLFMAIAVEGLRGSLMAWMDVAGPKFDQAMEREKQFEEKYGQRVDDMIALIFAPPSGDAEAEAAEEEAIRRAQGIL